MTEESQDRIDFSAVDPTPHLDRIVGKIMDRSAFELARRRQRGSALALLGRWQRPMAIAAALAVIVSYSVLTGVEQPTPGEDTGSSFGEYIGLPTEIARWVGEDDLPAATDVLFLANEETP